MTLTVERLHPLFAAAVSGIDMRGEVDAAALREFVAAMAEYGVCVVHHDTPPTDQQHIAFSARLGPIEGRQIVKVTGAEGMRIPHHEIIDQSNLDETGEIYADDDRRLMFKRANRQWHTDISFHPIRATYSLLAAHVVPPDGADTEFVDMRAVHDALPDAMKARIEGLVAEHSYWHSRVTGGGPEPTDDELRSRPPAHHKLVHVHAGSGRKVLYLASHALGIDGWPPDDARALLAELMAFATQARFIYRHHWRVGEVAVWDNLCTMHRATPFDDRTQRRDMRRTTCRESEVAF